MDTFYLCVMMFYLFDYQYKKQEIPAFSYLCHRYR